MSASIDTKARVAMTLKAYKAAQEKVKNAPLSAKGRINGNVLNGAARTLAKGLEDAGVKAARAQHMAQSWAIKVRAAA